MFNISISRKKKKPFDSSLSCLSQVKLKQSKLIQHLGTSVRWIRSSKKYKNTNFVPEIPHLCVKTWTKSFLTVRPVDQVRGPNQLKRLSKMSLRCCSVFLSVFFLLSSLMCHSCLSSLVNHGLLLQHTWMQISPLKHPFLALLGIVILQCIENLHILILI